ncbi:MAG: LysE family translocator [Burkholderiaceae bacterium]
MLDLPALPTLLVFCGVAFIGIVTPGPTTLLALSNGSRLGVRASLPGMAGAVMSDLVLIGAVAAGLGGLLAASEFWFSMLKLAGVVYLAYLGVCLLRSRGTLPLDEEPDAAARPSARTVFMRSFLVAITNPKGYLFFSAFLPQFVSPTTAQAPQYLSLAALFVTIDFVVMLGYSGAGARAVRTLRARGALWLDRLCGGTLLLLAGFLALYRRQP